MSVLRPPLLSLAPLALLLLSPLAAQTDKDSLAIGAVEVNAALETSAAADGTLPSLEQLQQSLDGELLNAFQQTRRFDLFARSDLAEILGEQDLAASGNLDPNDPDTAEAFQLGGVQYLVVTELSAFRDRTETARFESIGKRATARTIEAVAIARIYDTTTARLLESARVTAAARDFAEERDATTARGSGATGTVVADTANRLAQAVAERTVQVLYPARIVGKAGRTVMFNRGDSFPIEPGDRWTVYAEGEEMIDPDTGESLGSLQADVGTVVVREVLPRTTRAEIEEDFGIAVGNIVRPAE
jgi:curli biogenesis system outer membrane secretion channel CsgG